MIELFLDTSTKYITLAIIKDNVQCYFFHDKVFEDLSIKIIPLIKQAFDECQLNAKDIDRIYVTNGPGSFTGIRIGLTIMKVMAWSLNIKIIPVSSLELMATTKVDTDYIIPYIDARRGNCFVAVYDTSLNNVIQDQFVNFETFIDNIEPSKTFKVVSYDDVNHENHIYPQIDIMKIINKHRYDKPINPHLVNPNYLKKTEAEENLKRKNDCQD